MNRRQYLTGGLGFGAAILVGTTAAHRPRATHHSINSADERSTNERLRDSGLVATTAQAHALGTKVSITALHASPERAREAVSAAWAEMETVERVMSLYRPDSQIRQLNRDKRLASPHPYLLDLLKVVHSIHEASRGAFDVTVQPLWDLYARRLDEGRSPSARDLVDATRHVGWRHVHVTSRGITLAEPGAAITLNGIAQGFAVDRAAAALRAHGVHDGLIDTGELGALGGRADDSSWTIGIQHPRRSDAFMSLVHLRDRFLATSGDYATRFGPGSHHIFDPRTGRSAAELASVSVAAPSGALADGLATACFVLGLDAGLALVESLPDCDAQFATLGNEVHTTARFPVAG